MPRAGLTADLVAAQAAQVIDERGYDRLTLASVAQRCGVAVPSLYNHVDGLEALQRRVAVLATRQLAAALSAATIGRSGADALRAMAEAFREYVTTHPGRYQATVGVARHGDAEYEAATEAAVDVVLGVLSAYGLAGTAAIDAARAVRSVLHGFVTLEAAGGFGLAADIERSYTRVVDGLDAMLIAGAFT